MVHLKSIALFGWCMIAAFLIAESASAVGVTPARRVVDFEPGLKTELSLNIINTQKADFDAVAYVSGELAPYIRLKENYIEFSSDDHSKSLRYELNLPQSFDKPGLHKADITVVEVIRSSKEAQDTAVGASASITAEVYVRVPYPEKYIEANMHISSEEKKIRFAIPVRNLGEEEISSIKAIVQITGATYEHIAQLETNRVALKPGRDSTLVAEWEPDLNPGVYHAVAIIDYDGYAIRVEKDFNVGSHFIDIYEIDVPDFRLGDIAEINIKIQNKWNQEAKEVYAELEVKDRKQNIYTTFKTASEDIKPLGFGTLKAYWNTRGVEPGIYLLDIMLHYEGRTTHREIEAEVSPEGIMTSLSTGHAVRKESGFSSREIALIVVILAIVNIEFFIIIRKRSKKKNK